MNLRDEVGGERYCLEDRRRLSTGPEGLLGLADEWRLTEEQQIRMLGMPLISSFHHWSRRARGGHDLALGVSVLMRISAVLGIYGSLRVLFENGDEILDWLRSPHDAAPFAGRAPLSMITSGSMEDLMTVRRMLAAAEQGQAQPPNVIDQSFVPY